MKHLNLNEQGETIKQFFLSLPVDRQLEHVAGRRRKEVRADDKRKDHRPALEDRREDGEREPDDAEAADV